MEKTYKNCQSCGMPLKNEPQNHGTNDDGSYSNKYCSYCFAHGKFIYTGTDVGDFQDYCKQKMIEGGHNKFISWLFTRGMSRLERWKK